MSVCGCVNEYRYPWSPEEGNGSLGTGVTGSCESPNMNDRNQAPVFCKRNVCSNL